MSGHDNHHLPNSDEGRTSDDSRRSESESDSESDGESNSESNKRQRVAAVEEETDMEQLEDRLHDVQRRCPSQTNVLQGDALKQWLEDAAGVTEDIQRLILRNGGQRQRRKQRSDARNNDNRLSWLREVRLKFYEFCFSLMCNRPSVHKVEIRTSAYEHDVFPDGRLLYLGNAMLQNTQITELVVDVDVILEEPGFTKTVASLIEFVRTSTTLRKVGVNNNLNDTTDGMQYNCRFAASILDAITANVSIAELSIYGVYPVDAFHTLMSTSTTLKVLHIDCSDFDRIVNHGHRNQLLHSLERNRSIEHLSLTVIRDEGWVWLNEIQRRMASGPAKVRKLKLQNCRKLPPAFYDLMGTTSLQTLELDCNFSKKDKHKLQRALAKNSSIENLQLLAHFDPDAIDDVLLHLHNGPSTLRKLSLSSPIEDFGALRQYLCRTTVMPENLELEECVMDEDCAIDLMECLQELDSRQSEATVQLELKSCRVCEASIAKLVEFVAARNKCHNRQHNHPQVSASWLWDNEKPNLVAAMRSPPETNVRTNHLFAFDIGDCIVLSMSTTLLLPSSSSSSSEISSFHSGPTHFISVSTLPIGDFFPYHDSLMKQVDESSLVCLQLSHIGPDEIEDIVPYLPRLTSLCALHLLNIQDGVLPEDILKGLQRNGSLLVTTFLSEGQRPFFQKRRDRIIIQSYCQRNHNLSQMILGKKLVCNNASSVGMQPTVVNGVDVDDGSCANKNGLVLLPKLFRVAIPIPLMRSQVLLAVLLKLDMAVGPQGEQDSV